MKSSNISPAQTFCQVSTSTLYVMNHSYLQLLKVDVPCYPPYGKKKFIYNNDKQKQVNSCYNAILKCSRKFKTSVSYATLCKQHTVLSNSNANNN